MSSTSIEPIVKVLDPDFVEPYFFAGKNPIKRRISTIKPSPLVDSNPIWHSESTGLNIFVISGCGIDQDKVYV